MKKIVGKPFEKGNPGKPKGAKNKATTFKELWKAGLEKVVAEHGGPEQFVRDFLASRHGKQEINSHMLKVVQPVTDKLDVNHSGGIEVVIVDAIDKRKT